MPEGKGTELIKEGRLGGNIEPRGGPPFWEGAGTAHRDSKERTVLGEP